MTMAGTGVSAPSAHADLPGVLTRGWTEAAKTIDAVRPFWPELAEHAASDNPFFDPAFLAPAATALDASVELVTVSASDGKLLAMLPVTTHRLGRIAPALRAFAHHYAPLAQPVVASAGLEANAAALIEGVLDRAGRTGMVVLPELVDSDVTAAIERAAKTAGRSVTRIDAYQRAAFDRDRDGTDPRAALAKRRRKEYARLLRRLGDEGTVAFEHAVAPADIAERLEDFIALEAAGWKGRRQTAMASQPAFADFARTAITGLARRGAASAITLRVGERPAAILICLHQNRTALTWKIAYDESLAQYSPGAQLMLEAPRFLFANERIQRIDSCATANHPMANHVWHGRQSMTTLVIGPARQRWRKGVALAADRTETALRNLARNAVQTIRPRTR